MSFAYVARPEKPAWSGVLPGSPQPYFLRKGEGEHAKLFTDTFTVMLSGDETGGQFGMFVANCPTGDVIPAHAHDDTHETFYIVEGRVRVYVQLPDGEKTSRLLGEGDFGFVPAGAAHAYRVEAAARILGAATGGFERFFQQMGTPADTVDMQSPPFVPDMPRMQAAARAHNMRFLPGFEWPEAETP
ncbi:quercetin 2,3-dioxygenase [Actinoplanes sp. URMC 104]|uniref:quercetin 2,3-dioxygenase n=1 Tax=Actinoplanes sp. URMC 104 TaxID=3423409 RepID=UPI003F1B797B